MGQSKSKETFDPGKIILWAENGLESLFIALESSIEKQLKWLHKKDKKKGRIKRAEKERRQRNRLIAKEQDISIERHNQNAMRNKVFEKNEEIMERLSELEKMNDARSPSQDLESIKE